MEEVVQRHNKNIDVLLKKKWCTELEEAHKQTKSKHVSFVKSESECKEIAKQLNIASENYERRLDEVNTNHQKKLRNALSLLEESRSHVLRLEKTNIKIARDNEVELKKTKVSI